MENIRKNPLLMGILSAVGCAVALLLIDLVLSMTNQRTFTEQISDPVNLIILIVGPICTGISSYVKAKKELQKKKAQ